MPTYEYRCDNGHTFEITQSMSEDALESCTVCGAPAQRILFAPAVHFKGSGFYTTDYAKKGANKSGSSEGEGGSKSESSSDSKSESSSESKSESKPDSKSESKAKD